jgi:hypothetical protein
MSSLIAPATCRKDMRQIAEMQGEWRNLGCMARISLGIRVSGIGTTVAAAKKVNLGADLGSQWRRWEPHVHAPGTVLNDQFKGPEAWERYLDALESRLPAICALGVTDYYSLDSYERVCAKKAKGRLAHCGLIFPNVELRLKLGTVKGAWVNLHLLVSPQSWFSVLICRISARNSISIRGRPPREFDFQRQ